MPHLAQKIFIEICLKHLVKRRKRLIVAVYVSDAAAIDPTFTTFKLACRTFLIACAIAQQHGIVKQMPALGSVRT